jgi:large subunit ribosomal protein L24
MAASFHVKKGDIVTVISGDADKFDEQGNLIRVGIKGKSGKVLQVFPKNGRVTVEGLRIIKKHQKPTQKNQQGGIQEREGTIAISNVRLSEESPKEKDKDKAKTKKPAAKSKTAKTKKK